MSKTKELKPIDELYTETISKYQFDDLVKLHKTLTGVITAQANTMKMQGEKASQVLDLLKNGK